MIITNNWSPKSVFASTQQKARTLTPEREPPRLAQTNQPPSVAVIEINVTVIITSCGTLQQVESLIHCQAQGQHLECRPKGPSLVLHFYDRGLIIAIIVLALPPDARLCKILPVVPSRCDCVLNVRLTDPIPISTRTRRGSR
ncbi:hypothetical protein HBI56_230330 [Parastagonospora nodorum]|uniref:Uncharacterized protein n=1 Tax=Phaeosphaeria nodorum (strain SN15 / ATCC MYA-4574 / FGSC 10173) TaxID=321614 RepID=A0A7U2FFN2_PHANO|nr:hypothetical protein HBH56_223260 [Parastagonospora nodorum]QRD04382.1 hypothetical protein JI435_421040 [Parastagonospora nodorum SN15]KAH3921951.1 hypothetical protein HBH54_231410 [Parastagonospora nodorum]KAH3939475.1 hypothetical protein HBH53_235380 [Parastagonospora nodorum]KAH3957218.1 hypothetical protein HBH51_228750 [Parastagonospora nodorum]